MVAAFIDEVLEADRQAPRKQRHTARRLYQRILSEFPDAAVAESTVRVELREKSAPDETSAVTEGVGDLPVAVSPERIPERVQHLGTCSHGTSS